MATLTRKMVRDMAPGQFLPLAFNSADEVESAYQTAIQVIKEMKTQGKVIKASKSFKTLSVVLRTPGELSPAFT